MKPVVVHLSNDYPDPVIPEKTRAVKALVEGTEDEFTHFVYSLNRFNGWTGMNMTPFGDRHRVISYKALPKGFFWKSRLRAIAKVIAADMRVRGIVPDLIEAHKFTIEGIIGLELAKKFSCHLVVDIQGDTDTNILAKKPSYRPLYRDIARTAKIVFPFAPWALPAFEKTIGLDKNKCILLPVVPGIDTMSPCDVVSGNKLLTVFNIDSWKRKNIIGVMAAIQKLLHQFPDLTLDVYGRGKQKNIDAMRKAIAESAVAERVHFKGAAENGTLPQLMKNYVAFVQPSLRETYGLVFAEALFAGLPIVMPKDRGIDGYLPTDAIGYACDPHDFDDIASGIHHVLTNQAQIKSSISDLQKNGSLDILRKHKILENYSAGLRRALTLNA